MHVDRGRILRIVWAGMFVVVLGNLYQVLDKSPFTLGNLGDAWVAVILGLIGIIIAVIVVNAVRIMLDIR